MPHTFDPSAQEKLINELTLAKAIYLRSRDHNPTLFQKNEMMTTLSERIASMKPIDTAISIMMFIYAEVLYPTDGMGEYLQKADEYIARTKNRGTPTN